MTGKRSAADERLLDLYRCHARACDPAEIAAADLVRPLLILDCRALLNVRANTIKGKGIEDTRAYTNCTVEYADIGNIHVMRESLAQLAELAAPSVGHDDAHDDARGDPSWHRRLSETGWLQHVSLVLEAAVGVAARLVSGVSVLVHCSDGWDRTAQVCALAQLLLEPHYRTIEGFATLVEKDWCAFGHKFGERCGHGSEHKRDERSPIFVQWLDTVHQLVEQFPRAFEFDGRLLTFLADAMHSCLFGTFLADCEREREREARARERTESVWTYVFDRRAVFSASPPGSFVPDDEALWPVTAVKRLRLWEQYYCRWDADFHPLAPPAVASTALTGAAATATSAGASAFEPDFGDSPKSLQRTSRDAASASSGDGPPDEHLDESMMDAGMRVRSIRKSMDEVRI